MGHKLATILAAMLFSSAAESKEILISCEYNDKVFMGIVETAKSGPQRIFGYDARVDEHKDGFLRVSIQMGVETYELIFSGRSGVMSYNTGEIDQNVQCRLEVLSPPSKAAPVVRPPVQTSSDQHDYLWYLNRDGMQMSYITENP